jgi:hypothetical protein
VTPDNLLTSLPFLKLAGQKYHYATHSARDNANINNAIRHTTDSIYFPLPASFTFPFSLSFLIILSASPIASVPTLQLLNTTPLSLIISSARAHLCLHICSRLLPYPSPAPPPPFMPNVDPVLLRFKPWRGAPVENGADV